MFVSRCDGFNSFTYKWVYARHVSSVTCQMGRLLLSFCLIFSTYEKNDTEQKTATDRIFNITYFQQLILYIVLVPCTPKQPRVNQQLYKHPPHKIKSASTKGMKDEESFNLSQLHT